MYFVKYKQLILEFSFAILGTSAAIEKVFSITNSLWTDEKNRFVVETMKAVIVPKTHFEEHSCNDFYTLISNISKITSRNSFIYEVQDICPRGKNNAFNINWKLTSNKIL
jgi:hypothetical protein